MANMTFDKKKQKSHFLFYFFYLGFTPCKAENNHYEAWSYKKKRKELTDKRCLLILDLKPFRSWVKGKHSAGKEFQNRAVRGKKLLA